jgi:magnesium chelatase family protein
MIASIPSAVLVGVDGKPVAVEVHVSNGLPGFTMVGLPDTAVRESRDRVRAALLSSGLPWPLRRVTVNLAPSGMRKGGAGLDLPIAIGVLVASGAVDVRLVEGLAFFGELGLDGSLRGVPGTVALAEVLAPFQLVVPAESGREAQLAGNIDILTSTTLAGLVAGLSHRKQWRATSAFAMAPVPNRCVLGAEGAGRMDRSGGPWALVGQSGSERTPDLADVYGQRFPRRALEVAAAGGHHILLVGSPGSGKSMLAARLPGLLPDLPRSVALEVTRIHSVAGLPLPPTGLIERPPFRAPHHGATAVAMIGGGTSWMRPGEISLAHTRVFQCHSKGASPTGTCGRVDDNWCRYSLPNTFLATVIAAIALGQPA